MNTPALSGPAETERIVSHFLESESAGFFIGISHFQDPLFQAIDHAVDDAIDLAFLFAFELALIPPDRCLLALSGIAAKPASRKRLEQLLQAGAGRAPATFTDLYRQLDGHCQKAGRKGLLVISLATHGMSDQGKVLIGAADTIRRRPVRTSIQLSDFIDTIGRSVCPRRLVLLDTCRTRITGQTRSVSALGAEFATAMTRVKGTAILSAAAEGGRAFDDPDRGNGVFTGAVLDGLRGEATADADGYITAGSLGDFVQQRVRGWISVHHPEMSASFPGISCSFDSSTRKLPLVFRPRNGIEESAPREAESESLAMAPSGARASSRRSRPHTRKAAAGPTDQRSGELSLAILAPLAGLVVAFFLLTDSGSAAPSLIERVGNMNISQILSSPWGFGSIAAFSLGIFLMITLAVVKKAQPGKFDGQQTYHFFRLAMALAFLLALAALAVASFRESGIRSGGGQDRSEKIKQLALELKSDDLSRRRQASEALVAYGGVAAEELVMMIREEAGGLVGQTTSGGWSALFTGLIGGVKPWNTPFLDTAALTLARIGEPAVPAILNGLAEDAAEAELLLEEQGQRAANMEQQMQDSGSETNLLQSFSDLGASWGVAGSTARIMMAREVLASALRGMDPVATSLLLDGLESPQDLVRMTCYQVLSADPASRAPTIERLRTLALKAAAPERDQILDVVRQLEGQNG